MTAAEDVKYAQAESDRKRRINAIVNYKSHKKIVVAGPGTGKTHLFKTILQSKKNGLTLTFINTLVEDLALNLQGISDVKTLHGFARGIMRSATNNEVKIFRRLPSVIQDDGTVLERPAVNFEALFHEMKIEGENFQFYKSRKDYYGYYGFADVIFGAVKYLELHKQKIPNFDQIVVDEFQDFNLLEVALIDLLSENSPILLVGDDDQALYDFKSASPDHIRMRYSDKCPDFEPFNLPYCFRCTRVIVDAVGDIVTAATNEGYLRGRVPKAFNYYIHKDKDDDCKKYPKISYARLQARQIPWFIAKSIREIAADLKEEFGVLIISPARIHCRDIAYGLRAKGFANVTYSDRRESDELHLLDGLKILLEDNECNLGWRIASKFFITNDEIASALKRSMEDASRPFRNLIPNRARTKIRKLVALLRKVRDGKSIDPDAIDLLLEALDLDAKEVSVKALQTDLITESRNAGDPAIRKMPIRTSTIQGAKGLAEDYVFITHFDDQYYLDTDQNKNKVNSDLSICKFLVGITRARKNVFLLSSDPTKEPTFLKWISDERIELVFDANDGLG